MICITIFDCNNVNALRKVVYIRDEKRIEEDNFVIVYIHIYIYIYIFINQQHCTLIHENFAIKDLVNYVAEVLKFVVS